MNYFLVIYKDGFYFHFYADDTHLSTAVQPDHMTAKHPQSFYFRFSFYHNLTEDFLTLNAGELLQA